LARKIRRTPRNWGDLKSCEAYITVAKEEPAGHFTEPWYSIDTICKGCQMHCGTASPIRKKVDLQPAFLKHVARIRDCLEGRKNRTRGVHIFIEDFRKAQKGLEVFT